MRIWAGSGPEELHLKEPVPVIPALFCHLKGKCSHSEEGDGYHSHFFRDSLREYESLSDLMPHEVKFSFASLMIADIPPPSVRSEIAFSISLRLDNSTVNVVSLFLTLFSFHARRILR